MANKLPYMQFYVDDWLMDTQPMSCAARGVYIGVLCHMWRQGGSLPDDERHVRHLTYTGDPRNWPAIWAQVRPFLMLTDDGRLSQKRLIDTVSMVQQKRSANAAAAMKRWHGRSKPLKSNDQADAFASQTHMRFDANARGNANGDAKGIPIQNQKEPHHKGDDGSVSPLPPQSEQSALPRSAALADGSLHSARPRAGSQAAFVAANRPAPSAPVIDLWEFSKPKPDIPKRGQFDDESSEQDRAYFFWLANHMTPLEAHMTAEQCRITALDQVDLPPGVTLPSITAWEVIDHSRSGLNGAVPRGLPRWIRRVLTAYADHEPFPAMPGYMRVWAVELGLMALFPGEKQAVQEPPQGVPLSGLMGALKRNREDKP